MSAFLDQLLDLPGIVVEYAFECLRTATVPAGLLAAVVFVVQFTCRAWLRPAQRGLLWGIVLVRLMLPAAPQSALSLQSVFQKVSVRTEAVVSVSRVQSADRQDPWSAGAPGKDYNARQAIAAPMAIEESLLVSALEWWPMAWLLGCMAILLVTPCRYAMFAWRLRRCESYNSSRLANLVAECRARLFVRREVVAIVTDLVRQPAVMGVWRPKLLLPPHLVERSDVELRMVVLHELAHVRQWDVAVNWLLLIVRAVHWPNPVYWLAASRFIHLREQARDSMVLGAIEGDVRHDYSELLLSLAERGGAPARWRVLLPGLLPGLLCGLFEKRVLAARLKAIGRAGTRQPWWQTAIAIVALVAALVTGCTDPVAAVETADLSTTDIATQLAVQQGRGRVYWSVGTTHEELSSQEAVESCIYDVTAAVKQIAAIHDMHVEVAAEAARQTAAGILSAMPTKPGADPAVPATATLQSRSENDRRTFEINAAPSQHARIVRLIQAWETGGLTQICIEARFIGSPIELGPAHRVEWRSLSALNVAVPSPEAATHTATFVTGSSAIEQRLPVMTTVIDGTVLQELATLFQQDARSNIMFAPKITMFNGQSGTITSQVQRPFVTGVRLVDGHREPQIEVCPDGIQMEVRPVLSADRTSLRLSGRAYLSSIIDVKTTSARLTDGPVTIQLPRVERRTIDFQSELRDGESMLVACPPPSDGKGYFYLALKVRVIGDVTLSVAPGLPVNR